MTGLGQYIQQADWKKEKHVPVIEAPAKVEAGKAFGITVSLGKEIAHPNTTEHHISYITLYFQPEGSKATYQVGHYEFSAHGEAASGPTPREPTPGAPAGAASAYPFLRPRGAVRPSAGKLDGNPDTLSFRKKGTHPLFWPKTRRLKSRLLK